VRCGIVGTVQLLIEAGADIEAKCKRDVSALFYAALAGSIASCETLINAGVNVNAADDAGRTALFRILRRDGVRQEVDILIQGGADPNIRMHNGATPLMRAAFYETSNACEQLLHAGADIEACTKDGHTAVFPAVHENNHTALRALIKHKASLNRINRYGRSLIHLAAWYADVETMRILQAAHIRDLPKEHKAVQGYWRWFSQRGETMDEHRRESVEVEQAAFLALLCGVIPSYPLSVSRNSEICIPGAYPVESD
jgi:ankyrin repeat protein